MRKDIHYFGLDLLRFLAAWLVVADHFGSYGWTTASATVGSEALAFPFLHGMENIGSIGVEIFFLISGFVIAASAKGTTATQFALSRAIRVVPALWICGLIALAARATTGEPIVQLVGFFLRNASLSPAGPYIDGVVWTLVVEAVFYILIFLVLTRDGFSQIDLVAKILGLASAAFLVVMAMASFGAHANAHLATLAALCDRFPFKVLLLRHGVFFALGMMLWSGFEYGFARTKVWWMIALAAFCTLEIAINRGSPQDTLIAIGLWWAGFAVIALSVAQCDRVYRALRAVTQPIKSMGRFSYPLYLNHYTLGMVLVPALARHGLSRPMVLAASLGIVAVSSYLIMRFPERLIQKALRSSFRGALKPKAAVPSMLTGASA